MNEQTHHALEAAGFTVTEITGDQFPNATAVRALNASGQLGYLRASDEWVDVHGEPLPDEQQDAAHRLAEDGQLPEFANLL